jgi:hypothetical protein
MKNSSDIPGYGWTNRRARSILRNIDKNDDNKDYVNEDNDDTIKSGFNCMLCSYRDLPSWHFKVNYIYLHFYLILYSHP